MSTILIYLILGSPLIWLLSISLLKDWKLIWKFSLVNLLIFLSYVALILFTNIIDFGHDEYGLGKLMGLITAIVGHIILGFIFAIEYKRTSRTTANKNAASRPIDDELEG